MEYQEFVRAVKEEVNRKLEGEIKPSFIRQ